MRHLPWALAGFLAGLGLASCKSSGLNPEHCENNDGDASCLARYPDGSRPYCGRGTCYLEAYDGCIAEMPADPACSSPCGGQTYGDEPEGRECIDGGTATGDDGGTLTNPTDDGTATTGPGPDTDSGMTMGMTDDTGTASTDDGPMGCTGNDDCTEADAPFCVQMICSPCSAADDPDAACAEKFPDTPACSASTCVQCSDDTHCTDAATPICNTATNTCEPCSSHDQCDGDAACHLVTGECFPADEVYYVDSSAACPGAGTMASPWCLIQSHINEIPASGARTFHLAAGNTNSENLLVTGNRQVALLGDVSNPGVFFSPGPTESYRIDIAGPSSAVFTDATIFSGNTAVVAVRVDDGIFYATRAEFVSNTRGVIEASNGADIYLRNSILGANGTAFVLTPAIAAADSNIEILYSTLAANNGTAPNSLDCGNNVMGSVRNSIVAGAAPSSIDCEDLAFTYSLVDTAALGPTNVVQNFNPAWFPNIAMSDFHVAPTGPFDGLAVWQTGDPPTDIDGDARPNTDGAADFAGADVP